MHAERTTAQPNRPSLRPALIRRARSRAVPLRRDARRFGMAMPRFDLAPAAAAAVATRGSDLRLALQAYAAAFLFVTVFLA